MLDTGRLARYATWSLGGQVAPVVAAVVAVPLLLGSLGAERFGIVSLFWLTVTYFSLFDLGLGPATAQRVAKRTGRGDDEDLGPLVWTGLTVMMLLGVAGGLALFLIAPVLTRDLLEIPAELQPEAELAFRTLALAIPGMTVASGLRGILEARQRFAEANIVRSATGLSQFLGPLALLGFEPALVWIALVLVVTRYAAAVAYLVLIVRSLPGLRRFRLDRREVRGLVNFGGWLTVSNVISPILVNVDRLFIGSMLSVAAVAYYATPFELVTKVGIIPGALMAILFPAFAAAVGSGRPEQAHALLERGLGWVLALVFPVLLFVVLAAEPLLALWIGADFAAEAAPVLRLLAIGVLCNSVAFVPITFVQAVGRPDLAAKLHLVELPLYLLALWPLAKHFGLTGVALAWILRVSLDLVLLSFVSGAVLKARVRWGRLATALAAAVGTLTLGAFPGSFGLRLAAGLTGLGLFAALATFVWRGERLPVPGRSDESPDDAPRSAWGQYPSESSS